MPEVTETPPQFTAPPPPAKEHWKVREKREREEAAAKAGAPADAPAAPVKPPEMPVGGWPGDTPPPLVATVNSTSEAMPVLPCAVVPFALFAERYFLSNQIRPSAYEAPKAIRSMAADCITAYHAYVYATALGSGLATKSPEGKRFGGVFAISADVAKAVALMDREMDGR